MGSSLQLLVASVVGMTALMMTTKAYVDRYIPKPPASDKKASDKSKKKKKKGTLGESFAVLKSSPMISNLALLVVGYGLTHRLFEFCWKGQLRLLYPSAAAYQVDFVLPPCNMSPLLHVSKLCPLPSFQPLLLEGPMPFPMGMVRVRKNEGSLMERFDQSSLG